MVYAYTKELDMKQITKVQWIQTSCALIDWLEQNGLCTMTGDEKCYVEEESFKELSSLSPPVLVQEALDEIGSKLEDKLDVIFYS